MTITNMLRVANLLKNASKSNVFQIEVRNYLIYNFDYIIIT